MKKTFYEERNVQKVTRVLETLGYLIADGVGPHGTNRWAIPLERTSDGGVKIAPQPMKKADAENAPEGNAPEGNAPEGNAPEPRVVEVKSIYIDIPVDEDFALIAKKLATLSGGGLNPTSADLISTWMQKHTKEWIFKAIDIARDKGAGPKYADTVLIGWEANGYPKSREERVKGAKNNGNHVTGNKQSARPKQQASQPAAETNAGKLAEINRRRKLKQQPASV